MGRFQKENLKATLEWSRQSRIRQRERLDSLDNLDNLGIKIGIWMHSNANMQRGQAHNHNEAAGLSWLIAM